MSGVHDNLVRDMNGFLARLVDDGCFDLASLFFDILEEHDLIDPDYEDPDASEDED